MEALDARPEFPRGAGSLFAALGLAFLVAQRFIGRILLIKCLSGRKFAGTNIVLITDQPPSKNAGLSETLAILGFCVNGRFDLPRVGSDPAFRKRLSARVIEHIRNSEIDEIVVESNPERWSDLRAFLADLRVLRGGIRLASASYTEPWKRRLRGTSERSPNGGSVRDQAAD
jgi:putative colanic acid biosynthesis UDP-glucose lipid carrier transferase